MEFLYPLLISFLLGVISLALTLPWLRTYLLDMPVNRSSHSIPIPRGGGVVFVCISSFASLFYLIHHLHDQTQNVAGLLPLLCLPLAVIGLWDDFKNLPVYLRLICQLFTAIVLVVTSSLVESSFWMFPIFIVLVISVMSIINFTNFMDGMDGLVGSCMSISILVTCIQINAPFPIWALEGSLLAFLIFNWSPAKVFMGDVGSTFLGGIFAGLNLQLNSWTIALAILLINVHYSVIPLLVYCVESTRVIEYSNRIAFICFNVYTELA